MKWLLYFVAGVLGLVVLAVIVLLAMGGGRGESQLAANVDIAKPPAVVFSWISRPDHLKSWVGWMVDVRSLTPTQTGVGTREVWVMEDRNNNNQRMEIHSEIVDFRENHALTARLNAAEGFVGTIQYALEPLDPNRTRLHYTASYNYHHWLAKLMEPLITRSAQHKLEEDLARLKQQAEAQ